MKLRIFTAAPIVALMAACSPSAGDEANAGEAEDAALAAPAAASALSGEAGFTTAANCYVQLGAVSRLFSALAEQSEGAERQEMADLAIARELAADQYQLMANRLAEEIGQSAEVTNQAFNQAQAAVDREFGAREFQDFAVWVGEQADQCPPPDIG